MIRLAKPPGAYITMNRKTRPRYSSQALVSSDSSTKATTISTAPANPLALIEFNKAGKAVNATLLEGSGFDSVDQPIIDSLYGWTVDVAKSPQLQKLKPGQTLKFKIRLILK